MIRKTIFWIHLICGVTTALVILMMSVTGVILTYERQMLAWQTRDFYVEPQSEAVRAPIESLVASAALAEPGFQATAVRLSSDRRAPAVLTAGPAGTRYLDPYTAEVLGVPPEGLGDFFGAITGWHRWFNAPPETRAPWRAVTGISNVVFLFLIASGIYLWLPRVYKWAMFRAHLFFNRNALRGQARDYNWHHVFGFWSAIPLFVVVATAVVFSYPWASDAVYRAFGEEPPAGRGPPRPPPAPVDAAPEAARVQAATVEAAPVDPAAVAGAQAGEPTAAAHGTPTDEADHRPTAAAAAREPLPLDELFERAANRVDDWKTITITLPSRDATTVAFAIDQGNGGQPQLRHNLTLDAATGAVADWAPFESQTPGRKARSWIRFLHTGEALGIVGQTIAGIVSLTSIVMVWTGLALAWRRLIVPLYRRQRAYGR